MQSIEADVAIIGAGPAGLQAAIHSARRKVRTVVIGRPEQGALFKAEIENYLGIPKISGQEMVKIGLEQAKKAGAMVHEEDVMKAEKVGDLFVLETDHDRKITAKSIILAPGISRTKLNVEGEKEFLGRGVSYCAACDANFFKGKKVAVVGNDSMAAVSTVLMTNFASDVYWVTKEPKVAPPLMEKVNATKAKVLKGGWPKKVHGEQKVNKLELADGQMLEVDGVFIELGARGSADLAMELGILPDPSGRINVNGKMETEVPGVFAAGDVTGRPWQLARAVGQGCIAGTNAAKFALYGPGDLE
ncbi:MAG: FAD-dependent oxidoreductase [Methanomassiliicoccales archaeon]|nr:FAD-dependent oxidoreductase [Methanomassiliicoccales archaeon]